MGRPGRSACALCGMGKRKSFIAGACSGCGSPVCERHSALEADGRLVCRRCKRDSARRR